ncbi:hypothetical protein [Gemmatimonas sp.]|uniref:hypothetical protein n=1 Tax=Gemmatimonas sp. TaxID=1962908 RepID=UPI003F7154D0
MKVRALFLRPVAWLLAAGALSACQADSTIAPEGVDHSPTQNLQVTVWKVHGGELQYVSQDGIAPTDLSVPRPPLPSAASLKRKHELEDALIGAAIADAMAPGRVAPQSPGAALSLSRPVRPKLKGARSLPLGVVKGKRVSLQIAQQDNRSGRRTTMITEIDGRATEIGTLVFGSGLRKNQLVSSTGYVLDAKGRVVLVTDATATPTQVGTLSVPQRMRALLGLATVAIQQAILPRVAHAAPATVDESCFEESEEQAVAEGGSCWAAAGKLALAALAQTAASTQYLIALEACIALPLTCVSVPPAFQMLVVAAGAVMYEGAALADCLAARCKKKPDYTTTAPPGGGGGGSGGGGTGPSNCREIVWEISYDDGQTWEYLDSDTICD